MTLESQPRPTRSGNGAELPPTDAAPVDKPRRPGRPKGSKNKTTDDMAQFIRANGRPLEVLCSIAAGHRLRVGSPENPNAGVIWQWPSLEQRRKAAEGLLRKILPDLRSQEISGKDGKPLLTTDNSVAGRRELAKAVLAVLGSAVVGASRGGARPQEKTRPPVEGAAEEGHPQIPVLAHTVLAPVPEKKSTEKNQDGAEAMPSPPDVGSVFPIPQAPDRLSVTLVERGEDGVETWHVLAKAAGDGVIADGSTREEAERSARRLIASGRI